MIRKDQIKRRPLVLVVDDQEINRDALEVILEEDHDLLFAENGQEAMEQIREHAERLSLVLLDLMMPVMNGFEVLEAVRADEQLKQIPVIVLTADKNAELRALQMGAADFITKPFDVHEVIPARVDRIIELSEGRNLISAAECDRLTGLYDRNFFAEYVNRLFRYHPEIRLDAVALNIEQFHLINALHGRDFGDEVLRAVAGEIRDFLAETEGIASRIEADRFGIFCAPQEDYRLLLDRIQRRVDQVADNVSIHIRMGISLWGEGIEPVRLADRARVACGMARGNFQHPLIIFSEEMRRREMLDKQLVNDLRNALEERQFLVYYQPKYDTRCDPPRLSSAEALVRWEHPERGMISPEDFIPLFESNGLITQVDRYVWQEAARQVVRWKEKYNKTFPVSINLSRPDLSDPELSARLKALVEDNGLNYSDIKLEITESAYAQNEKQMLELIRGLRETGFEVEMDDFGSGYSSLNMLSAMPIDVLKMDMKFVRNIEQSETDLNLVKLILDIARYLRLKVVAEGAETAGQVSLLKDAGCNLVQGFFFSRPLPAEEFELLIEREQETDA